MAETPSPDTTEDVEVVRSTSPPPICAICLERCKNACFTDSCVHQFCFKCLCKWSKVKTECPLCKQAIRSIIHYVKAIDQYEEYLVQQPVEQMSCTRSAGTSESRIQSRSSTQAGMHSPMSLLSFAITTTSEGSETPGLSVAISTGSSRGHTQVDLDLDDSSSDETDSSSTNSNRSISTGSSRGHAQVDLDLDGTLEIIDSSSDETDSASTNSNTSNSANDNSNTRTGSSSGSAASANTVNTNTNNTNANANVNTGNNEVALPASASNLISEGSQVHQQSTSTGLRQRTVRQLVASKRQSTSNQHQGSSIPSKKCRMRTRSMKTLPECSSDGSTSDDDFKRDDCEYSTRLRRSAIRNRPGSRRT